MSHTLLLADDSVTIQRVIELTFADEDVHVVAVSDGTQAIAVLDQSPPDIVLADVGMPGRSGYEVAAHVKTTPKLAHIPVVLLTRAFEEVDQIRASAVGCDAVLTKPFDPQHVIGRVKDLLARPRDVPGETNPFGLADGFTPWTGAFENEPDATSTELAPVDIDSYFDRLDRAFANLSASSDADVRMPPPPFSHTADPDRAAPIGTPPDRGAPAEPPVIARDRAPQAPGSKPDIPVHRQLPTLGEAFAALLAAEQRSGARESEPAWPSSVESLEITDDLVEAVARRALERLSEGALRESVIDIVTAVAERLVREEIERIKASIR